MLQIVYVSTARDGAESLSAILAASQRNNTRDGITGLLFANGKRFLQVLEGPKENVDATLARIQRDTRHRSIVILSRREITAPEFGHWSMTSPRDGEDQQMLLDRIAALLSRASPAVRATFEGFAALKRAA